ncbi:MAG: hypothetical protein M1823_003566 [Watsoniomyces obsoletus]|nr:MAG: hypothetical protein M1823_003566 [Watsoniomyces obsoletus]
MSSLATMATPTAVSLATPSFSQLHKPTVVSINTPAAASVYVPPPRSRASRTVYRKIAGVNSMGPELVAGADAGPPSGYPDTNVIQSINGGAAPTGVGAPPNSGADAIPSQVLQAINGTGATSNGPPADDANTNPMVSQVSELVAAGSSDDNGTPSAYPDANSIVSQLSQPVTNDAAMPNEMMRNSGPRSLARTEGPATGSADGANAGPRRPNHPSSGDDRGPAHGRHGARDAVGQEDDMPESPAGFGSWDPTSDSDDSSDNASPDRLERRQEAAGEEITDSSNGDKKSKKRPSTNKKESGSGSGSILRGIADWLIDNASQRTNSTLIRNLIPRSFATSTKNNTTPLEQPKPRRKPRPTKLDNGGTRLQTRNAQESPKRKPRPSRTESGGSRLVARDAQNDDAESRGSGRIAVSNGDERGSGRRTARSSQAVEDGNRGSGRLATILRNLFSRSVAPTTRNSTLPWDTQEKPRKRPNQPKQGRGRLMTRDGQPKPRRKPRPSRTESGGSRLVARDAQNDDAESRGSGRIAINNGDERGTGRIAIGNGDERGSGRVSIGSGDDRGSGRVAIGREDERGSGKIAIGNEERGSGRIAIRIGDERRSGRMAGSGSLGPRQDQEDEEDDKDSRPNPEMDEEVNDNEPTPARDGFPTGPSDERPQGSEPAMPITAGRASGRLQRRQADMPKEQSPTRGTNCGSIPAGGSFSPAEVDEDDRGSGRDMATDFGSAQDEENNRGSGRISFSGTSERGSGRLHRRQSGSQDNNSSRITAKDIWNFLTGIANRFIGGGNSQSSSTTSSSTPAQRLRRRQLSSDVERASSGWSAPRAEVPAPKKPSPRESQQGQRKEDVKSVHQATALVARDISDLIADGTPPKRTRVQTVRQPQPTRVPTPVCTPPGRPRAGSGDPKAVQDNRGCGIAKRQVTTRVAPWRPDPTPSPVFTVIRTTFDTSLMPNPTVAARVG